MAKITDLLITELDHEAIGIRKALENVPEGKNDWKPHDKSMPLGLAGNDRRHHSRLDRHGREYG